MVNAEYITTSKDLQITDGQNASIDFDLYTDEGAVYVETILVNFESFAVKEEPDFFDATYKIRFLTKTPNNNILDSTELKNVNVPRNTQITIDNSTSTITYNEYVQKGKNLHIEMKGQDDNVSFAEDKTVTFTIQLIGRRAV